MVLSAYADDVLLVVQDSGDLARVEACQAIYLAASSAQVNWVKSSGLAEGDWQQESSLPPVLQTIQWSRVESCSKREDHVSLDWSLSSSSDNVELMFSPVIILEERVRNNFFTTIQLAEDLLTKT
ncbi:unnamed protein product [Caretta caretta]